MICRLGTLCYNILLYPTCMFAEAFDAITVARRCFRFVGIFQRSRLPNTRQRVLNGEGLQIWFHRRQVYWLGITEQKNVSARRTSPYNSPRAVRRFVLISNLCVDFPDLSLTHTHISTAYNEKKIPFGHV